MKLAHHLHPNLCPTLPPSSSCCDADKGRPNQESIKVPIPQSVRAHIIGKQGSTIKALQEKTGARIQLPKAEDIPAYPADDDDDATIDVTVEGNAISAAAARDAILKIAGERTANVNAKVRDIPSEFYPFIADPIACDEMEDLVEELAPEVVRWHHNSGVDRMLNVIERSQAKWSE